MKYYQAEMEAKEFEKGTHSLKEWANFGFNKVVYDGKEYWDGLVNGCEPIGDDVEDLAEEYWDMDEDGYKYIKLYKEEA